jgi:Uma2 family endonuclease
MPTTTKVWTLEELDSLPDDGNTYELIDGVLFVTPAPSDEHETIGARLTRLLDPYVERHGLGYVYHPRAVVQRDRSQVEPDLMVRAQKRAGTKDWIDAPLPLLVVEVLSPATRRRDVLQKRDFYRRIGVAEYWVVDPEERTITSVAADRADRIARDTIVWHPRGASDALTVQLSDVFGVP